MLQSHQDERLRLVHLTHMPCFIPWLWKGSKSPYKAGAHANQIMNVNYIEKGIGVASG